MPIYRLEIHWTTWATLYKPAMSTTKREGPFWARTQEQALARLQTERSFLNGLPWHFAGRGYRLLRFNPWPPGFAPIRVGEKFPEPRAEDYD